MTHCGTRRASTLMPLGLFLLTLTVYYDRTCDDEVIGWASDVGHCRAKRRKLDDDDMFNEGGNADEDAF